MHVTGDRTVEHGLATVAFDDEGVEAQTFDLVRDGVLVGYQLDRRIAAVKRASAGRTAARSPTRPAHVPIQRMANVSLAPAPGDGADDRGAHRRRRATASTSSATRAGRSTCSGTTSSSPGSASSGSSKGRLAGQLKDVAYQARRPTSGDRCDAVGGASTYLLGGAFNCGKGQPGQVAPVSHGCPSALFRGSTCSTPGRSRVDERPPTVASSPAHEVVERALERRRPPATASSSSRTRSDADVRFANNTTTTNGTRRDRQVTRRASVPVADGAPRVGVASGSGGGDVERARRPRPRRRRRRPRRPRTLRRSSRRRGPPARRTSPTRR